MRIQGGFKLLPEKRCSQPQECSSPEGKHALLVRDTTEAVSSSFEMAKWRGELRIRVLRLEKELHTDHRSVDEGPERFRLKMLPPCW